MEHRLAVEAAERRRAEEQFRAVVEHAPNGIVVVDERGRIRLVNRATEALFGYAREELIGQTVELLVPEAERAAHPGHRARYVAAPQARQMGHGRDLLGRRKDGSTVPVEIGLSPIMTTEGLRTLATIVDVSARKRAEADLAAALDRQKLLLRELSHRVANGFQLISALLTLQRRTVREQAAAEALAAAAERVHAMALIHRRLYLHESVGVQNVTTYLTGLCADLRSAFGHSGVSLECEGACDGTVPADKLVPLGLLATELVINALKHAHRPGEAGRIVLRWEEVAGGYRLTVADDGVGLPDGFDPLNTPGLGMLVIRSQVEQLGGTLTVDRTPPGVRFVVTLPALR